MPVDRERIYHKRDRLRQLRAFCHAARCENITRAAAELGITQSAVSMQIRELEHELEAVMFERTGPRITLSEAGQELLTIAEPLVKEMERLPEVCAEGSEGFTETLRIAAGPGAVAFVLPPYIRRLREEDPGLVVKLRTQRIGSALRLLGKGEVDLAVGAERFGSDEYAYHAAFSYKLVVIAGLDHPLAGRQSVQVQEAMRYQVVAPHEGTWARRYVEERARKAEVRLDIAAQARGWGVLKAYVEVGLGIAVVPDFCVRERDALSVIALDEQAKAQSFGFFTRGEEPLRHGARRLVEMAQTQGEAVEGRALDGEEQTRAMGETGHGTRVGRDAGDNW